MYVQYVKSLVIYVLYGRCQRRAEFIVLFGGGGCFRKGGNFLNFLFCQSKITLKDFIVSIVDTVYMIYVYYVFSVQQLYTNSKALKISMVYRRHSGVQDRLKAIPNQSNVKAMKVCIVLIIRRFVFQVQKNTFQGKIHTYNRNAMCYF